MTLEDYDRRVGFLLAEGRAVIEESLRLLEEAAAIRARYREHNPTPVPLGSDERAGD